MQSVALPIYDIFQQYGENKFREIESLKDETLISNRIKILIKNMFTNRANGWDKEKDQQEPMSKEEVAKMV